MKHFAFIIKESSHFLRFTAQKIKFPIKGFFSKCDQIRKFTEEILNEKFHFL